MLPHNKFSKIGIIGLGFVGLTLSMLLIEKGYVVIGIDVNPDKIDSIKKKKSYISDVSDESIRKVLDQGKFQPTMDYTSLSNVDTIIICVPTPLNEYGSPDLSYVISSAEKISQQSIKDKLIILESSTYPGTTEEVVLPILESGSKKAGRDFFLAYSPERINPGVNHTTLNKVPKVISGKTELCLQKISELYSSIFDKVVSVSSLRTAEMVKVMENSQRFLNISFVNEMAVFCERLKIDIWEVIQAIATKPSDDPLFYPGPGVGGHCIPVDPIYLQWKGKQLGLPSGFIDHSINVNNNMPTYIVKRIKTMLDNMDKSFTPTILLLGVTYKKDVNDIRESKALEVMSILFKEGFNVLYHDPFVPSVKIAGTNFDSMPLTEDLLKSVDCTVVLTDHTSIPWDQIIAKSPLIFDTRNVTENINSSSIEKL